MLISTEKKNLSCIELTIPIASLVAQMGKCLSTMQEAWV